MKKIIIIALLLCVAGPARIQNQKPKPVIPCFFMGEVMTRNMAVKKCYYDCMGSMISITVSLSEACPDIVIGD